MRSRAARFTFGAVAWLAIGGAAAFVVNSERHIAAERAAVRDFDLHAREAADALADLRASQQAYVGAGQGVAFWMPKVASTLDAATELVGALRRTAASAETSAALAAAAATLAGFRAADKRAR